MDKRSKTPKPYRGVQDEIHEQHMKMKDMSLKGKLQYFWDYYKIHTIVILASIAFLVTLIHDIRSAKDYGFYSIMLNSAGLSSISMEAAFSEYAGIDLETYDCFIDTDSRISYSSITQYDMATVQKLVALVQSREIDALVFDSEVFNNYANNEFFLDLNTFFTKEELAQYEDRLYYVDYAEIAKANEDTSYENEDLISTADAASLTIDDVLAEAQTHRHPEEMEQPIPVGIFLEGSPFAQQTGSYGQLQPVFGVSATTTRPDMAKKYLEFLWDETIDFGSMIEQYY